MLNEKFLNNIIVYEALSNAPYDTFTREGQKILNGIVDKIIGAFGMTVLSEHLQLDEERVKPFIENLLLVAEANVPRRHSKNNLAILLMPTFLYNPERDFDRNEFVFVEDDNHEFYLAIVGIDEVTCSDDDTVGIIPIINGYAEDDTAVSVKSIRIYKQAEGKVCPQCGKTLCYQHRQDMPHAYFCVECKQGFYEKDINP